MTLRPPLPLASLAVATLLLASCGSDDTTTSAASTTTIAAAPSTTAAPASSVPSTTAEPAPTAPTIAVVETPYGPALGTADGLVLYRWDQEADGQIRCVDDCLTTWPPLRVDGADTDLSVSAEAEAAGLDPSRLSLLTRPDGTAQVALDGVALYHMNVDGPGDANCQGGDGWWIANPDGSTNRSLDPV